MDGFPLMLVDTGADVSLLPMTFARALGVREEELRRTAMAGIGGGTTAYRLVHAPAIVARIGVHEVELSEVQFVPHAPLILGRDALFGNLELRMTRERIALRNTYSSP